MGSNCGMMTSMSLAEQSTFLKALGDSCSDRTTAAVCQSMVPITKDGIGQFNHKTAQHSIAQFDRSTAWGISGTGLGNLPKASLSQYSITRAGPCAEQLGRAGHLFLNLPYQ